MNTFKDTSEFFRNSLREILEGARLSFEFVKANYEEWSKVDPEDQANPGVLGIPACILYCCFIDAVGSVWLKNGGKTDRDNFTVLNSDYFDLKLTPDQIITIYNDFRSLLVHNALTERYIDLKTDDGIPFEFRGGKKGSIRIVRLGGLKVCCERAFEKIVSEALSSESFPRLMSGQNVVEPPRRAPSTTALTEDIHTKFV